MFKSAIPCKVFWLVCHFLFIISQEGREVFASNFRLVGNNHSMQFTTALRLVLQGAEGHCLCREHTDSFWDSILEDLSACTRTTSLTYSWPRRVFARSIPCITRELLFGQLPGCTKHAMQSKLCLFYICTPSTIPVLWYASHSHLSPLSSECVPCHMPAWARIIVRVTWYNTLRICGIGAPTQQGLCINALLKWSSFKECGTCWMRVRILHWYTVSQGKGCMEALTWSIFDFLLN